MLNMIKKIAMLAGFIALASTSTAAPINLLDTFNVSSGFQATITTDNPFQPRDPLYPSNTTPTGAPGTFGYSAFYGFVNDSTERLMNFIYQDADPVGTAARYKVYSATITGSGNTATASNLVLQAFPTVPNQTFIRDIAGNDLIPLFQVIFASGGSYVLEINKSVNDWNEFTTNVSAVPLPGAALLFGTALAGFFGFSNRRKV